MSVYFDFSTGGGQLYLLSVTLKWLEFHEVMKPARLLYSLEASAEAPRGLRQELPSPPPGEVYAESLTVQEAKL